MRTANHNQNISQDSHVGSRTRQKEPFFRGAYNGDAFFQPLRMAALPSPGGLPSSPPGNNRAVDRPGLNAKSEAPASISQHPCTTCIVQRQARQAGATSHATPGIASGIQSVRTSGQPLPHTSRAFFEPRFDKNFGEVRIHNDARANQLAGHINARAFTLGKNIIFGAGEYQPATNKGKKLLAHELTHVLQQKNLAVSGMIQADFALEPPHALPETDLTDAEVRDAIAFNSALLTDPNEIATLRDTLGVSPQPAVVDEDFVRAVARFQAQFGLQMNGRIDHPTRRQLGRETLAEMRYLDTIDTGFPSVIESNLAAFGLEQDDFGFNARGAYRGSRSLRPGTIRDIRSALGTRRVQDLIQENIDLLNSVEDRYSATELDLPFIITLGVRESGARTLFSSRSTLINTAGRDTHPAGRSGLDYFYRYQHRGFTSRRQRISRVTSGFRPGRGDRSPALIEKRRLLLAFMIKTAADEQTFRRFVREELLNILHDQQRADDEFNRLFEHLSIDALRSWKALTFAGVGYAQRAIHHILSTQHAAGEPFSLEAIMTLDSAPRVGAARLDRARAVALGALVIEGDLR